MVKNNNKTEKEKLLVEIERLKKELKKRKKYGLVWEPKDETVVEMCKVNLPVLKEIKTKEIITDKDKLVNLMIEGDNYHALSVLNYTHEKKIDVIYIDPPYNTGNKAWMYNNRYVDSDDAFKHSKWIAFMEKRLTLAKNLLSEKGIIIVAIDDYEYQSLRFLMDEKFGEQNRLGTIVVVHNPRGRNDDKYFATMHEYMLVYAIKSELVKIKHFTFTEEEIEKFDKEDEISRYNEVSFMRTGNNSNRDTRPNLFYPIYLSEKTGELSLDEKKGMIKVLPINVRGEEKTWRWGQETFEKNWKTELISRKSKSVWRIYKKRRLSSLKGRKPKTVWYEPRYDASSHGIVLLNKMFGKRDIFPYPKSIHTVRDILYLTTDKNSIVLDFFAGSGTTAHALMLLNREDKGDRRFIISTNNEGGISEKVCYPRIKKVIEGYGDEEGILSNLKYFRTSFVPAEPTDSNKIKLTKQAAEMLCVKEGTFEKVLDQKNFKIFKNSDHYTGIIFDQVVIQAFKKAIKDMKGKFSVYVFSLGDETFDEEFGDLKQKVQLSPIPEAILRVYRRIFR
jgi:adenine-specific DNA-methyltransferase